jgi:hypothetical protein
MYSAPAVGSVYWHSTRHCSENPSVRTILKADGAGLEPARPIGRLPCTPNGQSSVYRVLIGVCFQNGSQDVFESNDRRSCESESLRRSAIELRRCDCESRRWDSNPQPPAPKACTPTRQSVTFSVCLDRKPIRQRRRGTSEVLGRRRSASQQRLTKWLPRLVGLVDVVPVGSQAESTRHVARVVVQSAALECKAQRSCC